MWRSESVRLNGPAGGGAPAVATVGAICTLGAVLAAAGLIGDGLRLVDGALFALGPRRVHRGRFALAGFALGTLALLGFVILGVFAVALLAESVALALVLLFL